MYICLFDDELTVRFFPLTLTRATFDLRVGSESIAGLARRTFPDSSLLLQCRPALAAVMADRYDALVNHIPDGLDVLFLNSRWVPHRGELAAQLKTLESQADPVAFANGDEVVAAWVPSSRINSLNDGPWARDSFEQIGAQIENTTEQLLGSLWEILEILPRQIERDFKAFSGGYNVYERTGATIHPSAILEPGERIFAAPGVQIRAGAIINAEDGPVILDEGATIYEHSFIRGPAYIGRNARVNVGASLTTVAIGDSCKVGGEIHDCIIHSYSNKAHEGFLGNAYIGQWCNLGAGTNNSNLKNDYGVVSAYNFESDQFDSTGRQFAGLAMGDHSKCSIGTAFNTGTTIGVACNLYGGGFHPRMIPSFCWGGEGRYSTYRFEKAIHVSEIVEARRSITITDAEQELLKKVFEDSETRRTTFLETQS